MTQRIARKLAGAHPPCGCGKCKTCANRARRRGLRQPDVKIQRVLRVAKTDEELDREAEAWLARGAS